MHILNIWTSMITFTKHVNWNSPNLPLFFHPNQPTCGLTSSVNELKLCIALTLVELPPAIGSSVLKYHLQVDAWTKWPKFIRKQLLQHNFLILILQGLMAHCQTGDEPLPEWITVSIEWYTENHQMDMLWKCVYSWKCQLWCRLHFCLEWNVQLMLWVKNCSLMNINQSYTFLHCI